MVKRSDSRAMSTIVATLLIIMLTIVVIGVLWVVVKNLVSKDIELANIKKEFFAEHLEITSVKVEGNLARLSLKRIGGESHSKDLIYSTESVAYQEVDIVSIVDLSRSMVTCNGINKACCSTLGGNYISGSPLGNCTGVDVSKENICTETCSGSWVNRLTPAKEANKELINIISTVEGSRIGLVAYSANVIPSSTIGLTDNVEMLNNVIDSWDTDSYTCICCGINRASQILSEQSSDKRIKKIIVMSDGVANYKCTPHRYDSTQGPIDAINAACAANSSLKNLTIYSISFGAEANQATLEAIANCGNGSTLSVLNSEDLVGVYTQVAQEIITTSVIYNRFNYLYVVFHNETTEYVEKVFEIPQNLQVKGYTFNLEGKLEGEIIKIEVYPVILSKSGKEEIGPLFDSWVKK